MTNGRDLEPATYLNLERRNPRCLVDYVLDLGTPVPFVPTFADGVGGSPAAFEAFAGAVKRPTLEVVLAGSDAEVTIESVDDDRQHLRVPHWAVLAIF